MAIKECPQGHLYDGNIYASCPYCAGSASVINFDQPGRTAAPSGYSAPNATVAPSPAKRTCPHVHSMSVAYV